MVQIQQEVFTQLSAYGTCIRDCAPTHEIDYLSLPSPEVIVTLVHFHSTICWCGHGGIQQEGRKARSEAVSLVGWLGHSHATEGQDHLGNGQNEREERGAYGLQLVPRGVHESATVRSITILTLTFEYQTLIVYRDLTTHRRFVVRWVTIPTEKAFCGYNPLSR